MKKMIASAGLIAVGTASMHAAYAPGLTSQEAAKPWSVAASLRGFYDDNYASTVSALEDGSAGIEFRPSVSYRLPLDQTFIGLSYEYALQYYFDRVGKDTDQQHKFDAELSHTFSERYRLELNESLVYAEEPELIDAGTRTAFRSDSEAFRNTLGVDFTAQATEVIAAVVGYQNQYYDYKEDGIGSYSAMLDRVVHRFHLDGVYQLRESTTAGVGYSYWINNFTSSDLLSFATDPVTGDLIAFRGDDRDNNAHVFYATATRAFSPRLRGNVRVGAQYSDYSNPLFEDDWTPFVDLSGSYYYLPGSYVQLTVNVLRGATDFAGNATAADYIKGQEQANFVAALHHRITSMLTGSLYGQYQYGNFIGVGAYDGAVDNFFALGANLEYAINQFWSAEVGYNFDRNDSDINTRSFTRNRFYGGVRAEY